MTKWVKFLLSDESDQRKRTLILTIQTYNTLKSLSGNIENLTEKEATSYYKESWQLEDSIERNNFIDLFDYKDLYSIRHSFYKRFMDNALE